MIARPASYYLPRSPTSRPRQSEWYCGRGAHFNSSRWAKFAPNTQAYDEFSGRNGFGGYAVTSHWTILVGETELVRITDHARCPRSRTGRCPSSTRPSGTRCSPAGIGSSCGATIATRPTTGASCGSTRRIPERAERNRLAARYGLDAIMLDYRDPLDALFRSPRDPAAVRLVHWDTRWQEDHDGRRVETDWGRPQLPRPEAAAARVLRGVQPA